MLIRVNRDGQAGDWNQHWPQAREGPRVQGGGAIVHGDPKKSKEGSKGWFDQAREGPT